MAIGTSRAVELADTHLINRTRHQTALRLLPFLFILYITSYLDRTSVAYAAMGMSRDLYHFVDETGRAHPADFAGTQTSLRRTETRSRI